MDRFYDDDGLYDLRFAPGGADFAMPSRHAYGTVSLPMQSAWNAPGSDTPPQGWDLDAELAQMLSTVSGTGPAAAVPPHRAHRGPSSRRRTRADSHFLDGGQKVTHVTILIAAISVCAAVMLGWSVAYSYGQLRAIALSVLPVTLAQWWPLMVYGPWFVAALAIVRATVQHRSARRSWCIMVTASAMAVALCISHSSRSILAFVMVGIPPVTALVCFWELVGQVSPRCRSRHGAHSRQNSKP